jgi:hypothetical protein
MRGPYETSLNEFADCVCNVLESSKSYTYSQARQKCGLSYTTVRDYATMGLSDVNIRIGEKCNRGIRPQDITTIHPGFKVLPIDEGSLTPDSCTTELVDTQPRKQLIPLDLLSMQNHILDRASRGHLPAEKTRNTLIARPFPSKWSKFPHPGFP